MKSDITIEKLNVQTNQNEFLTEFSCWVTGIRSSQTQRLQIGNPVKGWHTLEEFQPNLIMGATHVVASTNNCVSYKSCINSRTAIRIVNKNGKILQVRPTLATGWRRYVRYLQTSYWWWSLRRKYRS
jgi:hypothetical protein